MKLNTGTSKIICMVFISMFIAACSGKTKQATIAHISVNPDKPTLFLGDVDFSSSSRASKVKIECSMLEKLSESILKSAKEYGVKIVNNKAVEKPNSDEFFLNVTYVDVTSHRWTLFSIRPSSNATLQADIVKDGKVIRSTQKMIGSGVALGACDRLEKIATTGGRYIAKWSSSQKL